MILHTLVVGPFMSNCYVIGDEKARKGIIVDPGADADGIMSTVDRLGLSIDTVVLTHTHVDHLGALKEVIEGTRARLAVHELESQGHVYKAMAQMFGPLMGGSFGKMPGTDRLLKEGDAIEAGELRFKVLHTPGHSPGGLCLLGEGVVFSGDTLFNLGIGRTDFPGCSFDDLMRSIRTKLLVLPDDTIVYPGHGPSTTIGAEKQWNSFLRM